MTRFSLCNQQCLIADQWLPTATEKTEHYNNPGVGGGRGHSRKCTYGDHCLDTAEISDTCSAVAVIHIFFNNKHVCMILLNTGIAADVKLAINSFPRRDFSQTYPGLLSISHAFLWQPSNYLIFPNFPNKLLSSSLNSGRFGTTSTMLAISQWEKTCHILHVRHSSSTAVDHASFWQKSATQVFTFYNKITNRMHKLRFCWIHFYSY